MSGLHVTAAYSLLYNASLMVEDGLGIALCFAGIINTDADSPLAFRPLSPAVKSYGSLIWKKYHVFSPAVQMFIDRIRESIAG